MKKIYFLSILTAGLFAFSSCHNDNVIGQPETNEDGDGIITDVIVTADDFVPQTRTAISNELTFTWAKNDKIGVFPGSDPEDPTPSSQVLFTANEGGAGSATFNGSGWGLMPARKYYAYFPYSSAAADSLVKFTFKSAATQSANNNTAHIGANDLMYTSGTAPSAGNTAQFQFHHLSSIMKFDVTVPEDVKTSKFVKAEISCADSVFPVVVSFNPTADVMKDSAETFIDKLTLTLASSGFAPADGVLSLWFMIGNADLSGKTLNVAVFDEYDKYSGTIEGADQKAGKAHRYELTVTKAARNYKDYTVDLGLPSGKLWAISNLTVKGLPFNNTVLGDYYAWGDTEPYYESIKVNGENNITVKWKSGYESGYSDTSYKKNTSRGSYTSSGAQLSLADDAAHAVLGGNWRMPSKADLDELAQYCTFASATVSGVAGVTVTSKSNGKSIFLPLNGYINGTTFKGYTDNSPGARFWLLDCADSGKAYQQYTAKSNPAKNYDSSKDKYRGTPIRPIYIPNN